MSDSDRERLRQAELSSARFALLSKVGSVLEEASDMLAGLQALVRMLTPLLGDVATISIIDDDGTILRLADATSEEEKGPAVSTARAAPVPDAMLPIVRDIMSTGRARLFVDYEAEVLTHVPPDDPYRVAMRDVSVKSSIFAPLRARGRSLGFITFAMLSNRQYAQDDVELAELVANRAGLALAHAQLLEREKAARAEAEAANRLKDQFLATMGHELRTPLNAILGWAQVLATPGMESRRQAAIDTITRNARAQARLIDDLIDISRITSQKLLFDSHRLDFSQLVTAAIETVRPSMAEKKLVLETDVEPGIFVVGDPGRLDQVIANLFSNAMKFSAPGGPIHVTLKLEDDRARLDVQDAGQGISAGFLPRIFERFAQEDSSSTRRHGGLGLGLAIAKSLVEMHGGTIRAASEGEQKGARFSVELPVATATPEE